MKKIFCFDLDGVICQTKKNYYSKAKPIKKSIKLINDLYYKGYKIIIFTARFMGRSNQNQKKAKKKGYKMTYNQLKKWGLNFHKLELGKPSFDVYVDDKNFNFKKNWIQDFKKKYKI